MATKGLRGGLTFGEAKTETITEGQKGSIEIVENRDEQYQKFGRNFFGVKSPKSTQLKDLSHSLKSEQKSMLSTSKINSTKNYEDAKSPSFRKGVGSFNEKD